MYNCPSCGSVEPVHICSGNITDYPSACPFTEKLNCGRLHELKEALIEVFAKLAEREKEIEKLDKKIGWLGLAYSRARYKGIDVADITQALADYDKALGLEEENG